MNNFLCAAVDDGPRAALQPVADCFECRVYGADESRAAERAYWLDFIRKSDIRAVIVGTSDSVHGRCVESALRQAASAAGKKIIAMEDYPGNYFAVAGARTDLLIVGCEFSRKLNRKKFGDDYAECLVCKPVRYDPYRVAAKQLRAQVEHIWAHQLSGSATVFWAGQPETSDALQTLQRVAPLFKEHDVVLRFKAHPRDVGYQQGVYQDFFLRNNIRYKDVTNVDINKCLASAPKLVLTQFSSVAIQAGFHGIPSLHLLYHDIAGKRLREKKGFPIPPWCEAGASFYVTDNAMQRDIFSFALFDASRRHSIIDCFDVFFWVGDRIAPALAAQLLNFLDSGKSSVKNNGFRVK